MFDTLLASRPQEASGPTSWGLIAAVGLHIVAIGAAIRPEAFPSARLPVEEVVLIPYRPAPGQEGGAGLVAPAVQVPPSLPLPPAVPPALKRGAHAAVIVL